MGGRQERVGASRPVQAGDDFSWTGSRRAGASLGRSAADWHALRKVSIENLLSVTMATAAKKASYLHIESTPEVWAGTARIAGTVSLSWISRSPTSRQSSRKRY